MASTGRRAGILVAIVLVLAQASRPAGADGLDQGARLAALAKVWGLLKYFHPGVAQGTMNWDTSLIDELPRIQAADSRTAFNDEIVRFMRSAGAPPRVAAGASLETPEAEPAFRWIDDDQLFDPPTIRELKTTRNAVIAGTNRYVRPVASVGNPDFATESAYNEIGPLPPTGLRFLALARFWNMVQYYAPNRDITDRPWGDVLTRLVPRFLEAATTSEYQLAVCELTASLNDTHAFTGSSALTTLWGTKSPAIRTRYIESQTVITDAFDFLTANADLRPGDIVTDVNGVSSEEARERLRPYVWASNEGALQRNIDTLLFRTNATTTTLGVSRFGVRKELVVPTAFLAQLNASTLAVDARPAKWRVLDGNIGYVHMGLLLQTDVAAMWAAVADTRAIVFDVRNYPQGTSRVSTSPHGRSVMSRFGA